MYLLNRSFQGVQNGTFAQCRLIIIFIYRFTSILGNKKFSGNTDPERWSNGLSAPTDSSHLTPKCILQAWKAASMKHFHNIYELGAGDCHYQSNLKARLQYHFMNQNLFPSPTTRIQSKEFVVSSCYNQECFTYDKEETIQMAAKLLQEDIVKN